MDVTEKLERWRALEQAAIRAEIDAEQVTRSNSDAELIKRANTVANATRVLADTAFRKLLKDDGAWSNTGPMGL
jgi:hypothetical protein